MESNFNFKLNRYLTIMVGIAFLLSIVVIYQANTINKLKNNKTSKFFLEAKLSREQVTAQTLHSLKALIDDENTSKECREIAASKYMDIAVAGSNETNIELILKSKGYDEVVAIITEDKVKIIMSHGKKLSNKQLSEIKDAVTSVTKVKDIEVETK